MGETGHRGDLKPIGDVLVGLCFDVVDSAQMASKADEIREKYSRDHDAFDAYRLSAFLSLSAIERCRHLEKEVADVGAALARCRARRRRPPARNGSPS